MTLRPGAARALRWTALSAILVGALQACSSSENIPAGSSSATGSSSSSGSSGAGGGASGKCSSPDDAPNLESLVHLGRAASDEFIEVLDVVVDHPIVYACTSVKGFNTWDASADGPPVALAAALAPPGLAGSGGKHPHCQHVGLDSANKKVVITNRGDELQPTPFIYLYDVADPANPVALRGWTGADSIEGAVISGNRIYAAAHSSGIIVFEDQGGSALVEVGRLTDAESDAWQPVLQGDRLLVAEGASGLRIYDVSGAVPAPIAALPIEGSSKDLIVRDGIAYVAASSRVAAVDVSDLSAPALVGEVETTGTAVALAASVNDTLLVAEWDKLRGYDISDPAAMKQELSEVLPTNKLFSRVLTVDAAPAIGRVYPGEWSGVHAYRQEPCGVGPDIEAATENIAFPTVAPGGLDVRALVLSNRGNRPLHITSITPGAPPLSVNETSLEIAPGKSAAVEVTFQPNKPDGLKSMVTFASDDPDQPSLVISVSGNVPGLDIGDPMPAFSLVDTEGVTWDSTALKGNIAVLSYFATF